MSDAFGLTSGRPADNALGLTSIPAPTNLRPDFAHMIKDGMLPPGTRVNSQGMPYSSLLDTSPPPAVGKPVWRQPADPSAQGAPPPLQAGDGALDMPPQLRDYVQRNMAIEGSGKDPRSSAVGGFINSTWLSLMRSRFPGRVAGMDDGQILALRSDPNLRALATAAYAAENAPILRAAGQEVTPFTMRLSHLLGPRGAVKLLSAPKDAPVDQVLSKEAIDANPSILAGTTAGGALELINAQWSGAKPDLLRMRETAFGAFNEQARARLDQWQGERARLGRNYEAALAEAKDLRSAARAALGKWMDESERPPQNMHETWKQWSGIASAFALLGGIFGRNHSAALASAGVMLQAANSADASAYDKAYGQWKDHLDRGLKLVELLNQDARSIIEDARKPYEDKLTELSTLSTAYNLNEKLDPESVYNQQKQLEMAKALQGLIEAQNETGAIKDLMDKAQAANPKMTRGEAYAAAKAQLRAGSGGWVVMTDPVNKDASGNPIQYRYNPNTGQATTLNNEPYQPGGAQKLSARADSAQAPVDPRQVDFVAKGIAEYRMAPLSGWAMNKPFGQAVMARVLEMNPEYNAAEYRARYIGETRFTTGKQGDTIRSFGTSIDHLETMQEAADALANGNVQALNRAKNKIAAQFGYEGPVDFNFVKSIVGAEVSKAIIGGVGTLTDREELQRGFDLMNSPQQAAGVIRMAKLLMAGQLKNLRHQAVSIGWDDDRFNQQLSPLARSALEEVERRGRTAPAPAGDVPLVTDQAGYDALPSGAKFRSPDGKIREKP
jgi:hypothetical protein